MDRKNTNHIQFNRRIGFHYYPDTIHYRDHDLNSWLPILKSLHATWIHLLAPRDRAIPESFIRGLIQNKIQPILHFSDEPEKMTANDLSPLLHAYSDWGVTHAIIFNQPNLRSAWSSASWARKNIVDQFLERFLPLAELAIQNNIKPVFPPLFPGGDYWDTVFFRSALQKINNGSENIIQHLHLSSMVWTWEKSLNWGAGGSQSHPTARPYSSTDQPDQRGFRNFEWYSMIAEEVTGVQMPIHLLGAGLPASPESASHPDYFQETLTDTVMQIAKLLAGDTPVQETGETHPLSENVLSASFWQLAADPAHAYAKQAWFQDKNAQLPVVAIFKQWAGASFEKEDLAWREKKKYLGLQALGFGADNVKKPPVVEKTETVDHSTGFLTAEKREVPPLSASPSPAIKPLPQQTTALHRSPGSVPASEAQKTTTQTGKSAGMIKPIEHYLLLPVYEWGIADWHLEVIRPFVKKHRVTVGFSVKEAALAKKVTVVGNTQSFSDELLAKLQSIGCEVERINGDGTSIASQLATR